MVRFKKIAKYLTYHGKTRVKDFLELELKDRAQVILLLSTTIQGQLLAKLPVEEIVKILELLDPDDSTDLLQLLPKKKQTTVLEKVGVELHNTLSMLLEFDPKTAAGLMSLNYILAQADQKLIEVASLVDKHEKRTGKVPTVLVVDGDQLMGFIPLQRFLFNETKQNAKNVVSKVRTITYSASTKEVSEMILQNPHQKLVVTGANGAVLGILYSDDVIRELKKTEAHSLYSFAGLQQEESVTDSGWQKVKHRYSWLILNLATAFLAAGVVGFFGETINKYVLLAVYMPIVAGMGGNAATQTLAVLVRGIGLGEIDFQNASKALRSEVWAGLVNGLLIGLLVFTIVLLTSQDIRVAAILGLAMICNMVVAGFFGTLVPLIMKKIGKDPATSATIIITTFTDVLGFAVFLGLAKQFLQ